MPIHWEVTELGQLGAFSKGSGGNKEDEVPKGVPCVRYGDLYSSHQYFIHNSRSCVNSTRAKDYTPIKFGDVLFAGSGETIEEIGKSSVNLMRTEARCSGDVILFRANRAVDAKFMGYATDCAPAATQKSKMGRGITVMHIYSDELKRLVLALPPLPEQSAIARFLDHMDRRISRYIRAKEKLIALLDEYKQALIHQAVTGQIDVRTGKPYGEYKESGVEWLPRVPGHWQVRKLGQVSNVFNGSTPSRLQPTYWDQGNIPWLNSSKVNDGTVHQPSEMVTEKALRECAISLVPSGSVIIGLIGQGRTRGMSALLRISATISQNLAAIIPGREVDGAFVKELLTALYDYIRELGRGGNQEALNCDLVARLRVPIPPVDEQHKIMSWLDEANPKLNGLIGSIAQQTKSMKAWRDRLIADVVTGKLDVREAAANLPDLDPLDAVSEIDESSTGTKGFGLDEVSAVA